MEQSDRSEQFVRQLTENQNRLYGYVYSLLGDHARAADVVQETNLVMWRKLDEFDPERPFLPWAFAIARYQVMAHFRDHKRDRLLLDEELAEKLSDEAASQAEQLDAIRSALRTCIQLLTPSGRELIENRYVRAMSTADIAATLEKTAGAIKVALLRTRRQLAECVQRRIAAEG